MKRREGEMYIYLRGLVDFRQGIVVSIQVLKTMIGQLRPTYAHHRCVKLQ